LSQLLGISRGVEYLHSRNPPVIHGDLHPGNVLLDWDDRAYLCDFGLSRIRHEVTRTRSMVNSQEGGYYRYMAPELTQELEERFRTSQESDVFSLAMTFLHAWSGEKPFGGKWNEWQVAELFQKRERPPRPPFEVDLADPEEAALWNLIVEMWAHEPRRRPSAATVVKRLTLIFPAETPANGRLGCVKDGAAVNGGVGEGSVIVEHPHRAATILQAL
ncbi:kinase-like protein, partial [Clavulina sp. PMI_390]